MGNSQHRRQHMSASCEVCPSWASVNKQMSVVPLWRNVKDGADTAMRGSHGVHQYFSWLCWNANTGGVGCTAVLRWRWRELDLDKRECEIQDVRAKAERGLAKYQSLCYSCYLALQLLAEDSKAKDCLHSKDISSQSSTPLFVPQRYCSLCDPELPVTYTIFPLT